MSDSEITFVVVPDDDSRLTDNTPSGWHKIADYDTFIKWQYQDTPYRVVATINEERGHWFATFTSSFSRSASSLIRGNLGGGRAGRRKAVAAATNFVEEHSNGCPPPGEIKI